MIISHTFSKKEYHNPGFEPKLDSYPNIEYPRSNVREQEISQRPTTQYMYTQNSDYLPGILNPVQTRTLTQCISIDSRFRDNFYTTQSSDFAVNIPNKIKKVLSIQLSSIEIIKENFYNISNSLKNNYLYISVISTEYEDEPKCVIIIPDGNYNTEQLIYVLNNLLKEKEETPFPNLFFSLDSSGSGRICLETIDDSIITIFLDFTMDETGNIDNNTVDYLSKIGRVLGFTKRKYKGQTYYMAETVVNTNIAFSYIYLSIEDFQNNSPPSFVTAFQNNTIPSSILARIQIGDSITFISEPRRYFGPVDLTRIQIRLLDAYGRILDMNSSDYSFCLLLNLVYDF